MALLGDEESKGIEESMQAFANLGDLTRLESSGLLTLAQCAMLTAAASDKPDVNAMADAYLRLISLDIASQKIDPKHPGTLIPYSEYLRMMEAGLYGENGSEMPSANLSWLISLDDAHEWVLSKGISIGLTAVKEDLTRTREQALKSTVTADAIRVNSPNRLTTLLVAKEEIIQAFRCKPELFESANKYAWVKNSRQAGKGGKNAIAPKFDPLAFAVNLPNTTYGNGITEAKAWNILAIHFPDRYSEISHYDPKNS